jgi:hypothetical protein
MVTNEKIKSLDEMTYERNAEEFDKDFPNFPKGFSKKQVEAIGKMSRNKDIDFKRASADGVFDEYRKKKSSKTKSKPKRKVTKKCKCK